MLKGKVKTFVLLCWPATDRSPHEGKVYRVNHKPEVPKPCQLAMLQYPPPKR